MKQAILITAHADFDHLMDVVHFFDDSFEVYIHIDRKSIVSKEIMDQLLAIEKVKFISRKYKVNWAGRNFLRSYLLLAKEAVKNPALVYFHSISGQDFPVKDLSHFKKLAEQSEQRDYMTYFEMPSKVWENGGMDRLQYYNFFDVFGSAKNKKWVFRLLKFQKKINFKRPLSNKVPKLYGGDNWWSLTRETLKYVVDYTNKKPYLLRRMKHTFAADEIYFQTVILNSPRAQHVANNSLRYIDWTSGRKAKPGGPAVLDMTDFEKINTSDVLFARKFQSPFSDALKFKFMKQQQ
ncbi:MAG: hypothetical protein JWO58_709 [Chitinophagaceae bacterium]|nr:hypothetical protein [Chitinophagaceae bacterium]